MRIILSFNNCTDACREYNEPCPCETCKHWINYEDDLNCSVIAADKNGPMTLEEIGKRLGLTLVRVKQIEEEALVKLKKRIIAKNDFYDTI
jgi:hypothetical protein